MSSESAPPAAAEPKLPWYERHVIDAEPQAFGVEVSLENASLWDELMDGQETPELAYELLLDKQVTNQALRKRAAALLTLPEENYKLPFTSPNAVSIGWLLAHHTRPDHSGYMADERLHLREDLADNPELAIELAQCILYWLDKDGGGAIEGYGFDDPWGEYHIVIKELLPVVDEDTADRLFADYMRLPSENPYIWMAKAWKDRQIPDKYRDSALSSLFGVARDEIESAPESVYELANENTVSALHTLTSASMFEDDNETSELVAEFMEEEIPDGQAYLNEPWVARFARGIADEDLRFRVLWRNIVYAPHPQDFAGDADDIDTLMWVLGESAKRGLDTHPGFEAIADVAQYIIERADALKYRVETRVTIATEAISRLTGGSGPVSRYDISPRQLAHETLNIAINEDTAERWREFTNRITITPDLLHEVLINKAVTDPEIRQLFLLTATAPKGYLPEGDIELLDTQMNHSDILETDDPVLAEEFAASLMFWHREVGDVDQLDERSRVRLLDRMLRLMHVTSQETADELFECSMQGASLVATLEDAFRFDSEDMLPEKYMSILEERLFSQAEQDLDAVLRQGGRSGEALNYIIDNIRVASFVRDPLERQLTIRGIHLLEKNLPNDAHYLNSYRSLKEVAESIEDYDIRFWFVWRHIGPVGAKLDYTIDDENFLASVEWTIEESKKRNLPGAADFEEAARSKIAEFKHQQEIEEERQSRLEQLWEKIRSS